MNQSIFRFQHDNNMNPTKKNDKGSLNEFCKTTKNFNCIPYVIVKSDNKNGPTGPTGPTGEVGPQGIAGEQGPIGPTGPQGEPGISGTSVSILGSYDSKEDLVNAHPTGKIGDSYLVDTDLYVWSPEENDWVNVGVIRGPQGIQGPTGDTGPQGIQGIQGVAGEPGIQGPQGQQGPKGDQGIQGEPGIQGLPGPIGPTGPQGKSGILEIESAYIVTFNNNNPDGYRVETNQRIPLTRKEVDNTNICTINTNTNTIKFNKGGTFRIDFVVNTYNQPSEPFNKNTDLVAIGFKKINEDIVYAGGSSWNTIDPSVKIVGQGIFVIADTETEEMELVNFSNKPIILNTPLLDSTTSKSYYVNPVVTIIIQFLG